MNSIRLFLPCLPGAKGHSHASNTLEENDMNRKALAYYMKNGCEVRNLAFYTGTGYQYRRLNNTNFTGHSLDGFVRHQTVAECWRQINNEWKLVPNVYEENWSLEQRREIAEDVVHHMNLDQTGFGAFEGERIIGFATVSRRIFGMTARYVQLVCFQISEEYRRQGIGRKLFSMACEEARQLGAEKLYISGHSSKESQAAYRALGCSFTEEINEELAAAEPFDVQMEYRL